MYPDSIEEAKLYLQNIHFSLSSLTYFNNNIFAAEETIIEDWNFIDLIHGKWKVNILSEYAIHKVFDFRKMWLEYKKKNVFGDDLTFTYFDPKWHALINDYLIPALDILELEMKDNQIDFISYLDYRDIDAHPNNEQLLERGRTLYNLLLTNKIIERRYIDK